MSGQSARAAVAGLATVLILAGCGGGSGASLAMSRGAASQLRSSVDAVHAAVASGDRIQAVQALASLQTSVTQLRHQGQVSSDRAAAILGAAADVEAQLGLMPTTTTTTTTTPTTTTTTTPDHPKKGPKGGGGGD
jgi:hypothetical protein